MSSRSQKKVKIQIKSRGGSRKGKATKAVEVMIGPTNHPRQTRRGMKSAPSQNGRSGPRNFKMLRVGGKVFAVRYTREENLGAVASPGAAFTVTQYVLNPGNNTTFPWLSRQGPFEKYIPHRIAFRMQSTSAESVGSTNTALGSYIMNTNYDILDPAFSSQQQMEDYGGKTEKAPFITSTHSVDMSRSGIGIDKERYILTSTGPTAVYPANSSAHDYDLGLFQIATVGQQAASTIGRLYVEYDITLLRPKLDTPIGQSLIAAHYAGNPTNTSAFAGMVAKANSTMALTFTNTSLTVPTVGRFLLTYLADVSTSFTQGGNMTASTNVTFVNAFIGSAVSYDLIGNAAARMSGTVVFDVSAPGGIITWAAPTIVSAGTASSDLYIVQVPGALALQSELKQEARLELLERKLSLVTAVIPPPEGPLDAFLRFAKEVRVLKLRKLDLDEEDHEFVDNQIAVLKRKMEAIKNNSTGIVIPHPHVLRCVSEIGREFDEAKESRHDVSVETSDDEQDIEIVESNDRHRRTIRRSEQVTPRRVDLTLSAADLLERIVRK